MQKDLKRLKEGGVPVFEVPQRKILKETTEDFLREAGLETSETKAPPLKQEFAVQPEPKEMQMEMPVSEVAEQEAEKALEEAREKALQEEKRRKEAEEAERKKQEELEKQNIESRPIWKPMNMQPVFEITQFLSAVGAVGEKPCFCDGSRSGIAGISGPDDGGLCPCGDVGQRHVDSGCSGDLDSLFRLLRGPLPSFRKITTRRDQTFLNWLDTFVAKLDMLLCNC